MKNKKYKLTKLGKKFFDNAEEANSFIRIFFIQGLIIIGVLTTINLFRVLLNI